jgi:Linalool dehydratase/isomerase
MNAWNPGMVQQYFPARIRAGLRRAADGTLSPFPHSVLANVEKARASGGAVDAIEDRAYQWRNPDLGTIAMFLSEMGDAATLAQLLAHADQHMQPTWVQGGLHYPRNDRNYDAAGNMIWMDPLTGNALLGYARLNVKNGMAAIYNQPWTRAHFARPAVQEVRGEVDLLRAHWEGDALRVTAKAVAGPVDATLRISGLGGRGWTVRRDGEVFATSSRVARSLLDPGGGLELRLQIDRATDLLVTQG